MLTEGPVLRPYRAALSSVTGCCETLPVLPAIRLVAAFVITAGVAAGAPALAAASDPGRPSDYYTLGGGVPSRFPSEDCVVTLCLGSPIEQARAWFGIENDRFALGRNVTSGNWYVPRGSRSMLFSAQWDRVGSITQLGIAPIAGHPRVRIALPGHLLLGRSSMGDVRRRFPHATRKSWSGEMTIFYEYRAVVGGEGSEVLVFTYSTTMGSPSDPKGFGAALDSKAISDFKVCFRRAECP
jgi:hypothetical protein